MSTKLCLAGGRASPLRTRCTLVVHVGSRLALFDEENRREIDSLWASHTWDLVDLPAGKKITGAQILGERKRGAKGAVEQHKGRLVARGDTQQYGVDYTDVWAPVARYASLRTLLAQCAAAGLRLGQVDIDTAFLNVPVEEEIYIIQPAGYERGDGNQVCHLRKALYGLKQAARTWYQKLTDTLGKAGFTRPLPLQATGEVRHGVCAGLR